MSQIALGGAEKFVRDCPVRGKQVCQIVVLGKKNVKNCLLRGPSPAGGPPHSIERTVWVPPRSDAAKKLSTLPDPPVLIVAEPWPPKFVPTGQFRFVWSLKVEGEGQERVGDAATSSWTFPLPPAP